MTDTCDDAALRDAVAILQLWRDEALQQCGRPGMAWMTRPMERTWAWLAKNTPPTGLPPLGTMRCPICGRDTPHHHTPEEIKASHVRGGL